MPKPNAFFLGENANCEAWVANADAETRFFFVLGFHEKQQNAEAEENSYKSTWSNKLRLPHFEAVLSKPGHREKLTKLDPAWLGFGRNTPFLGSPTQNSKKR